MDLHRYLNAQIARAQITAENQLAGETVSHREAGHLADTWALLAGQEKQVVQQMSPETIARAFMNISVDTRNQRIIELAYSATAA